MPSTQRMKWYALLAIGASFSAGGVWMIVDGAEHGWMVFLFFGLCAAVGVGKLWPDLFIRRSAPPDTLLQRFPGPLVLRVDRSKFLYLLVALAIFGGGALWVLRHEPLEWFGTIVLWFCVIACAAGIPFMIVLMLQGSTLRLDSEGLHVRHAWRSSRTPWADAGVFEVAILRIPASSEDVPLVVFDDAASRNSTLGAMNARMIGRSGALPDTYGLSHEELAWLLNQWRERAIAVGGASTVGA